MVMGAHDEAREEAATVYKTKVVQFLGRSVPIILQNDNGPCPLLALCNVLLLRNNVSLSLDMTEISLQRLLSLLAERLLDANSNTENKDDEYVRNQQQNIADAIELLPRLATGLDVNVRFRNIHDFEFTPECAVFDLLDIGLVHGWLCDPQDEVTSKVIGAHSYNTLVEKLVELQTSKAESLAASTSEDFVDFAAATTATLGVPSPSREFLSKTTSFEESEALALAERKERKGDAEEAAQLLQALEISKDDNPSGSEGVSTDNHLSFSAILNEEMSPEDRLKSTGPLSSNAEDVYKLPKLLDSDSEAVLAGTPFTKDDMEGSHSASHDILLEDRDVDESFVQVMPEEKQVNHEGRSVSPISVDMDLQTAEINGLQTRQDTQFLSSNPDVDVLVNLKEESSGLFNGGQNSSSQLPVFDEELSVYPSKEESEFLEIQTPFFPKKCQITAAEVTAAFKEQEYLEKGDTTVEQDRSVKENGGLDYNNGVEDNANSRLETCEPLYEGEAVLVEADTSVFESRELLFDFENREPLHKFESRELLYEGESILAERSDREAAEDNVSTSQSSSEGSKSKMKEESLSVAVTEGMIIENFLKSHASQLTYYGLFCLQEGLKERELCVFFRNNHFSTMFKYNGDLYLLATDQGYLNQPDLVWEKLHEVHGDSVFVTGIFTVFQADQSSGLWSEHDAVAATADYLSSHQISDTGAPEDGIHSNYHSDLQLAMALQQQEIEQQQQQQQQQTRTQSPASPQSHTHGSRMSARVDGSRLVTGPKTSSVPPKPEAKTKERLKLGPVEFMLKAFG